MKFEMVVTYLKPAQREALRKLAFETRLSQAEHLRRALANYLRQQQQKQKEAA